MLKKETAEAIIAADNALECLESAKKEMQKAKKWGDADMVVGGFIITYVKRRYMRRAIARLESAKYAIKSMHVKFSDIADKIPEGFEGTDLASFHDFFEDSLGSDVAIQDQIVVVQKQIDDAIEKLSAKKEELSRVVENARRDAMRGELSVKDGE